MLEFLSQKGLNNRKIKFCHRENIEPQEIFLDKMAQKKEEEMGITEKRIEVPLSFRVNVLFWIFCILGIFILFFLTFNFQIMNNEKYLVLAEKNKFIFHELAAIRGIIYDQNGNQLVYNKPGFDLVFERGEFPDCDLEKERVIGEILKIIKKNKDEITEIINSDEFVILKNIKHETLIILKSRIDSLPGFKIEQSFIREYVEGFSLSHILGYTGKISTEELNDFPNYSRLDYIGKTGIERYYESVLRIKSGKIKIERDAKGKQISNEIISLPEPGKSLTLWLDINFQKKMKEALEGALERTGSEKAVGIAIDPNSGGIISMVSIPDFNNNLFSFPEENSEIIKELLLDPSQSLFNRAIGGQYPAGSTIKPHIATAALEENIISPDKQIYAGGKIEIPHRYNPEIVYTYRDLQVHGWTDMRKAIAASVNVYFYTIGGGYKDQKGLGPTLIKKHLELFGWGEKTGIDLPGESSGLIPSPDWKMETKKEAWMDGDTYNLSIGQGDIFVTPLQIASAYSIIANWGTYYRPTIVKEIIDGENKEKIEPFVIKNNFINNENLKVIREGMRTTVTGENSPHASAVSLNSLPVKVAAKTGTAQISKPGYYHNWIGLFAPYEEPEIVLLILVEEVKGIQPATIPVAREILDWYFNKEEK